METKREQQEIQTPDQRCWIVPCLIALLVFVSLFFTSAQFPPTWDECITFERAENVGQWFSSVLSGNLLPGGDSLLLQEGFANHCIFTNVLDGYPAGSTIIVAAGHGLCQLFSENRVSFLSAYRFGDLLLFAIACGFCFRRCTAITANSNWKKGLPVDKTSKLNNNRGT